MGTLEQLQEVVAGDRPLRLVEEGIYSVLADRPHQHLYDKRAPLYDFVVGTLPYNFLMWGNSPGDYEAFARRAVSTPPGGKILDAGCGSLLFTARTHLRCGRQIVAFDQSIAMLKQARRRLIEAAGVVPDHIVLLQADLGDLPFRPASFQTILCMNVLHLYEAAEALVTNLGKLLAGGGHLYLTSLVTNNRLVGDWYLRALHAAGEFVRPRSSVDFKKILDDSLRGGVHCRTKGNMAYATTASFP